MTDITITNAQIATLAEEAATHGDLAMKLVCQFALAPDGAATYIAEAAANDMLDADGFPDFSGGGHTPAEERALRRAVRMTRDEARAECARIIAGAAAQAD